MTQDSLCLSRQALKVTELCVFVFNEVLQKWEYDMIAVHVAFDRYRSDVAITSPVL